MAFVLRDYQSNGVDAIFHQWDDGNQSTLLVLPTGGGKTICFAEVIRRMYPKRSIVCVHRKELAYQAKEKIEKVTGLECEIEMGDLKASSTFWNQKPVIITTIQTQCAGNNGLGRMARFDPNDFGLIILDEFHHATASTWKRVLDYYKQNPEIKILGVTATPDRADEEALGQIMDSVAFDYEILDAIQDGWLVPIHQRMIHIEGLDYSHMRTTAGDLNGADLAEVMEMEANLQGIASSIIQEAGARQTLVFTVSVKQAEAMSNIFNRHKEGCAEWVCGATPDGDRDENLKRFKTKEIQILTNVGVLTEGYDNPGVEVIAGARPTKSRSLYSQIIGRGTRPLPGIVDGIESPEARRAAIACSEKPFLTVLDFVGNAGRHKLMTTADILGGKVSDEAIERAIRAAKASGKSIDMSETLEEMEKRIEEERLAEIARRAKILAKASYRSTTINPFDVLELTPQKERGWDRGKSLSEKQRALLTKQGIDPSQMTYVQSRQVIADLFRRWNENLATFKQLKLLQRYGYETKGLTMKAASELIDKLAKNGWQRA